MPSPLAIFESDHSRLSTGLSLQASIDETELAANIHKAYGFDVVLTASSDRRRDPTKDLREGARRFTDLTGMTPELDANRYAGPNRDFGGARIDRGWCELQASLGVPIVTTNAGFLETVDDIRAAIASAQELQHVIDAPIRATISIPVSLLKTDANAVIDILGGSPLEVGLALGHGADPLGTKYAVEAVMKIASLGNVASRRIDLSGIGVLALGAPGAAIGTTATLRHVYPIKAGGGATSQYWSTLVEKSLSWRTHDRVLDASSVFRDEIFWTCLCDYCYGRQIYSSIRDKSAAIAHNYAVIARIAERVLSSPNPFTTWVEMCRHAQTYAYEVEAESGPAWAPQDFLGAWVASQASRVGH
ncbi:hypothetical protein EDF54_0960 [Rathayibacter sp. PhB93]|uniref:hypothetical protein n=1 Tax=unclassified Rathayibacter TaxID=2609250 RepID=UPI000FA20305|nr:MULTISPECIES: hypothetical protein [unclassified Rathayibacter]ROQ16080.1 hypothetical protein EDF54_0960 [Rathayibacter sp. PhB93]TDQ16021.1 hypothetical protein EDF17_0705 [Rathayibacter sp. PhB1]